jgi:hypothetical protein
MADLLECLIQIAALRDTLTHAEAVTRPIAGAGSPGPDRAGVAEAWTRMADAEARYARALGAAGAAGPSGEGSDDARGAFVALRRSNLARLDGCTAAQLGGVVEWPGRPSTTVADLVAIMLAYDTETLAESRRHGPARQAAADAPRKPPQPGR